MKKRILSLALVLVLCLGLAIPAMAAGTTETVEDEEQGVVITMYGFLRKETNRYMVNGEETELTFYVVEDNSAVKVSAMRGRSYAGPYLRSDGLMDWEIFRGYWYSGDPRVKEFAYKLGGQYSWNFSKKEFSKYKGEATPLYIEPETTVVMPQSSSYSMSVNWDYSVLWICESNFARLEPISGKTDVPETPVAPADNTAYPSTQKVEVDGKAIEFQCYALKDEAGNDTNYIKLRDLADILNGSAAQFEVGWDGNITITTKTAYTKNGSEQNTPFSGQRAYEKTAVKTLVDGKEAELDTFQLKDDNGGGYTYYKLRDLGKALGITVDWTAQRGIYIETK